MTKKRKKRKIVGIDEAGRGPLAGPVVAAAVMVKNWNTEIENWGQVRNSKELSALQREKIFQKVVNHTDIVWGVGVVSEKIIDRINILEATKLAMKRALEKIECRDTLVIIDGNFEIKTNLKQKSVVKGDEKIRECSLASIVAKVKRDRVMENYHKRYPEFGFNRHKGYGTKKHRDAIRKHGPSPIHRRSFNLFPGYGFKRHGPRK